MLLFVRLGTLMAVPFDPNAVTLSGSARPLQRGVLANVNSLVAFYETSSAGHLAFLEGEYAQPARRLVWMDRRGERTPASALTRPFSSPRISSDGRLILTWIQDAEVAVWLLSLGRDRLTRVTRGMDDHTAAWLPDGQRFVFDSSRSGNYDLYLGGVESPAQETQLTVEPIGHFVNTSLSDGRLALTSYDVGKDSDLWLMDTRAGAQPEPILQTPFSESEPAFSADGKLIAYVSEEANTKEVYVQRFPLAGPRVIASGNGGEEPSWSRSGTELYYRKGSDLFAVQVKAEGALEVTSPQRLFSGRFHYNLYPTNTYDVAPDGRFLMVEEAPPERRAIRVTLFLGDALRRDAALRQER